MAKILPSNLADRISAYLDDNPGNGGHSDAAGGSAWELLEEAMNDLRSIKDLAAWLLQQKTLHLNKERVALLKGIVGS